MDSRVEVQDAEIAAAFAILGENLKKRLLKHGKKSFIGNHEALGVIMEEIFELTEAVKGNDDGKVLSELLDVGVGALFGIASMMAIKRTKVVQAAM